MLSFRVQTFEGAQVLKRPRLFSTEFLELAVHGLLGILLRCAVAQSAQRTKPHLLAIARARSRAAQAHAAAPAPKALDGKKV